MGESPYKETTRSPRPISFEDYGGSAPENYERYFVPVIGTPLANDLVDVAVLRPGERVLDVACGTGVVARLAAERVEATGTVAGLDINPGMLSVARLVTPAGSPVKWYESSVEEMPLPDEAFDVVLCSLGMQFFPDKLAALREMRRVLAPGGRLVFNVPGPTPRAFVVLAKALSRHIDPGLAAFVNRVFSLYDPDELQQLMGDAGFRKGAAHSDTRTLRLPAPEEFLWQYVHSTPLVDAVVQADEKSRAALERDVIAGWQVFVEEGALLLQLDVTVATSQK